MNIIVAVDSDWGIGYNNELLFRVKEDLQRFKELTMDGTVVMGRKTFESIGKPLPGRRNVVLTKQQLNYEGVETVSSVEELLKLSGSRSDWWVIGGASIYEQLLPFCKYAYVTRTNVVSENVDSWFPNIENSNDWVRSYHGAVNVDPNGIKYTFDTYLNNDCIENWGR